MTNDDTPEWGANVVPCRLPTVLIAGSFAADESLAGELNRT